MRERETLSPPLELLRLKDCRSDARKEFIVEGLISPGNHAAILGHPGSGKSVLAPYLAHSVATGEPFMGKKTKQGRVLYIASEDGVGMEARCAALRKAYGDSDNFYLMPDAIDLRNNSSHPQELRSIIKRIRPSLIVLDTLTRAFVGWRENDAEDTGKLIATIRDLSSLAQSAFVSIHHIAKADGSFSPRGHGQLNADLDLCLLVEGLESRTVRVIKNRNGESGKDFVFGIETVKLSQNEDGSYNFAPICVENVKRR